MQPRERAAAAADRVRAASTMTTLSWSAPHEYCEYVRKLRVGPVRDCNSFIFGMYSTFAVRAMAARELDRTLGEHCASRTFSSISKPFTHWRAGPPPGPAPGPADDDSGPASYSRAGIRIHFSYAWIGGS